VTLALAQVPLRAVVPFAVAVLVLALLPLVLDVYVLNLFTLAFVMITGALAWNWMGGYVGQVSFGHAAMFGVGGFVAARLLLATPLPAPLAWIAGGLAAGIFALGAHPTLRLRGPYFSIATIGVGEASRLLFTYWERFTGGASGLSLPIVAGGKEALYFWALALAAGAVVASWAIRRSGLGLQLLAIKADVDAAADVGVSATFHQDLVFAISGAVVGMTGGLYASYFSFIEPNDMFGFDRSISFVLMAVIGGVGTVLGPALGAVVFVLLRQFLLASYPQLYLGLYGLLLVLIILFEPLGLTGLAGRVARRLGYQRGPGPAAAPLASSAAGSPPVAETPGGGKGRAP
jgi:branched-chain amino acid transport system permease protein